MPENGTAVAARTLPGVHPKGAYFTRGSGHNKFGGYTEIPDEYQEVMDRLLLKHKAAAQYVPAPVIESSTGARFGVITIGGCDLAVREALDLLAGTALLPTTCASAASRSSDKVDAFHRRTRLLLRGRAESRRATSYADPDRNQLAKEKLRSILSYGGFPLSATHVVQGICKSHGGQIAVYL